LLIEFSLLSLQIDLELTRLLAGLGDVSGNKLFLYKDGKSLPTLNISNLGAKLTLMQLITHILIGQVAGFILLQKLILIIYLIFSPMFLQKELLFLSHIIFIICFESP